ncbi:MAG: deoxyribonuclease V [Cyanobacteria bacterium P01_H01_bin.15]
MNSIQSHPWPNDAEAAAKIQNQLRSQVIKTDQFSEIKTVAGVDVGFEDDYAITRAAVVVLSYPGLLLLDSAIARKPTTFPYIPGFLSFREVPAILEAIEQLKTLPDLFMCDGQGYAHPRRFGIGCHLGVLLDLPTLGVAKSILVGKHAELPQTKGSWQPLIHREEVVGAALRSREKVKPIYISLGHKISLETSIQIVTNCLTRYKLPETTRQADKLASRKPGAPDLLNLPLF